MDSSQILDRVFSAYEYLKRLGVYAEYCADNKIGTLICHDFWLWIFIIFESIVGIFFLRWIINLIGERRLLAMHKRKQEARAAIADEETMNKYKWRDDGNSELNNLTQEEIAAKFREANLIK